MIDVELIHLTKKFKDTMAVDDVSLEIQQGEFFFLLGPSGCGKTTTLRIIGGLEDPDKGMVKIKGVDVTAKPPEARDTATVFQSWVAFGLKMRKKSKNEINEKVHNFLELVNLAGYETRFPAQLSGGQKQRVALARALVVEPAVLLLDEPLSALDLKLRQQMRFEIKRIQKSINVTTIFVTHDQTEALAMADRIVVMNEGRVVQIGSPNEIYYQPNSRFTSDFIGETNFIEGTVEGSETGNVTVNLSQGAQLKAFSTTEELPSGRVLVGIRPEHIQLKRKRPQTANNILKGRLIDMTFMGATLRFHIEFGDKIIAVDGVGSPEKAGKYSASEKVFLEIEPKNCLVLPAKSSK
jgi:ABC-type Fe3+/spermidine/putrescine transport system ATPase subunit